jgi:hypothetical protein
MTLSLAVETILETTRAGRKRKASENVVGNAEQAMALKKCKEQWSLWSKYVDSTQYIVG